MCHQRRRLLLRLAVGNGFHFYLTQFLLPFLHCLLIQVVENARTYGIPFHIHHGGGTVPGGERKRQALHPVPPGATSGVALSQEADLLRGGCDPEGPCCFLESMLPEA